MYNSTCFPYNMSNCVFHIPCFVCLSTCVLLALHVLYDLCFTLRISILVLFRHTTKVFQIFSYENVSNYMCFTTCALLFVYLFLCFSVIQQKYFNFFLIKMCQTTCVLLQITRFMCHMPCCVFYTRYYICFIVYVLHPIYLGK